MIRHLNICALARDLYSKKPRARAAARHRAGHAPLRRARLRGRTLPPPRARRAAAPWRRTPDVRKPRTSSSTPTARAPVIGAHAIATRAPHQRLRDGLERATAAAAGELHGMVWREERRDDLALCGGHEPRVRHERWRELREHRTQRKEEHHAVRGRRNDRRRRRRACAAVRRVAHGAGKLAGRTDEPVEPPLAAFADRLGKDTMQSSDNHVKSKCLDFKS